jgi:hypothetical protein
MQAPVLLRLPLFEVVSAAFRLPIQMRSQLWPPLQLPLAIMFFLQVVGGLVTVQQSLVGVLGLGLLGLVVTAMIAVPAHQIFIRGTLASGSGGLRWSTLETGYLGWSIGLPILVMLLASLVSTPLVLIANATGQPLFAQLAVFIGLLAGIAVYGRFSMVLPRVALGLEGGLRRAAEVAKGHTWRVGLVGVLFPLIISLIPVSVQGLLGPLGLPIAALLAMYFSVVQVAALALVYLWLQDYGNGSEDDPSADDSEQQHALPEDDSEHRP